MVRNGLLNSLGAGKKIVAPQNIVMQTNNGGRVKLLSVLHIPALIIIATLASLSAGSAFAQTVFKCVDERGRITYSQTGCYGYSRGQQISVRENSVDTSALRRRADAERWQQSSSEEHETTKGAAIGPSPSERALAQRKDLCDRLTQPTMGSRGMTAAQMQAVASVCAGAKIANEGAYGGSSAAAPSTIPAPPPAPSVITSCDAGGCWDNMGGRYNKGAGNTYVPSSGGACQMVGGQMHCP